MRKDNFKIIHIMFAAAFVVLIAIPSFFFLRPQKSEAVVPVIETNPAIIVPENTTALNTTGILAATTANLNAYVEKEFGFDPTAWFVAKIAVRQVTEQIVNWINSGFQGGPAFVTNPAGFFTDIADITAGELIRASAEWLCSPFQINVQLALQFNFKGSGTKNDWCRISDIYDNVQDAINNPNINVGISAKTQFGMERWFKISQNQKQTTELGAYVEAKNAITIKTANNQDIELMKLDWGKGLMSWEQCTEVAGPPTADGQSPKYCEIVTPGTVIESQLVKVVGNDIEQLNLADEFNEILGALANQLLLMAMGSERGLRGADKEFTYQLGQDKPNQIAPINPNDFNNPDGTPPISYEDMEEFYLTNGLQRIDLFGKSAIMSGSYNTPASYSALMDDFGELQTNYIGNTNAFSAIDNSKTTPPAITDTGEEPWILIDMEEVYDIKRLEIDTYDDGEGYALTDLCIFVSTDLDGQNGQGIKQNFAVNINEGLRYVVRVPSIANTPDSVQKICSQETTDGGKTLALNTDMTGRYVRIQRQPQQDGTSIKVSEIRVYQRNEDLITRSPIITLNGEGVENQGNNYYALVVDRGTDTSNTLNRIVASATDSDGNDISYRVERSPSGPINMNAANGSSQRFTYTARDSDNRVGQAILTVFIRDTRMPETE